MKTKYFRNMQFLLNSRENKDYSFGEIFLRTTTISSTDQNSNFV